MSHSDTVVSGTRLAPAPAGASRCWMAPVPAGASQFLLAASSGWRQPVLLFRISCCVSDFMCRISCVGSHVRGIIMTANGVGCAEEVHKTQSIQIRIKAGMRVRR